MLFLSGLIIIFTIQPIPAVSSIPSGNSGVKYLTLRICLMIERNTGLKVIYNYDRSVAALDLALHYANFFLMPVNATHNMTLTSHYVDIGSECLPKSQIIGYAMEVRDQGLICDVYIGPGCGSSAEALYDYADYYDTPIIGCPAAGLGAMDSIADYDKLTRISITFTTIGDVLSRFMAFANYTTPYFLQDRASEFYRELSMVVTSSIQRRYWKLYINSKFMVFNSSDNWSTNKTQRLLLDVRKRSRVVIITANADVVRIFMISAHKLGMTSGDYIFITIELYYSAVWGRYTWKYNDSNDELVRKAFRPLQVLCLQPLPTAEITNFWQSVKSISKKKYNYSLGHAELVDPVISHFYDAVILYATVVKEMAAAGLNYSSGGDFGDFTTNYTFRSPVNGPVSFNNDSDRLWYYIIRSFDSVDGRFEDFLGFPPVIDRVDILGDISDDWPKGLPPNEPFCGFDGLNPICRAKLGLTKGQYAVAIILPLLVVLSILFSFGYVLKRFRDQEKKRSLAWKIYHHQLSTFETNNVLIAIHGDQFGETISLHKTETTNPDTTVVLKASLEGKVFIYQGSRIQLRNIPEPRPRDSYLLHREIMAVQRIEFYALQKVIGILLTEHRVCEAVVGELCLKGCLDELLKDDSFDLDWEFKFSLMRDLSNGMTYIHASPLKSHGHLSSFNCLIDSRFVLKISDFGLPSFVPARVLEPPVDHLPDEMYEHYLWRAPEYLRDVMPVSGSQKGDIYSFSIVVQQILLLSEPFMLTKATGNNESTVSARDIVLEVKRGSQPPLRPPLKLTKSRIDTQLLQLIEACWDEDPDMRPAFSRVKVVFMLMRGKLGEASLVNHLVRKMEKYAIGLEKQIQEKTNQFMEEKERTGHLLSCILPKSIAQILMSGTNVHPETYDSVTVTFADVPGFLDVVKKGVPTAAAYIASLGSLQDLYDAVLEVRDVYRVESLYDALLVVSGLPTRNEGRHAEEIAMMVVEIQKRVSQLRLQGITKVNLRLRVGIHSGPCVAGIVGAKLPKYCLFGDTVNTASRMETSGEAGKIQCTLATKALLINNSHYVFESRGLVDVKGKGQMETFWLTSVTSGTDGVRIKLKSAQTDASED